MKLISNIEKIKILTNTLVNRDTMRVKILELFDIFCRDFPIKINAWIMDENKNIISRNATPVENSEKNITINDIFSDCAREKNSKMHERALSGETVTYIIKDGGSIYLTKLMASGLKDKVVFGVSIDITSFSNSIDALDIHCNNPESNKCEILQKVKNDNLYKILKSEEC